MIISVNVIYHHSHYDHRIYTTLDRNFVPNRRHALMHHLLTGRSNGGAYKCVVFEFHSFYTTISHYFFYVKRLKSFIGLTRQRPFYHFKRYMWKWSEPSSLLLCSSNQIHWNTRTHVCQIRRLLTWILWLTGQEKLVFTVNWKIFRAAHLLKNLILSVREDLRVKNVREREVWKLSETLTCYTKLPRARARSWPTPRPSKNWEKKIDNSKSFGNFPLPYVSYLKKDKDIFTENWIHLFYVDENRSVHVLNVILRAAKHDDFPLKCEHRSIITS